MWPMSARRMESECIQRQTSESNLKKKGTQSSEQTFCVRGAVICNGKYDRIKRTGNERKTKHVLA